MFYHNITGYRAHLPGSGDEDDRARLVTLLTVVGLHPEALTEALWKCKQVGDRAGRVHILTTLTGHERMKTALFEGGEASVWSRFCQEALEVDPFKPDIHVPLRPNGSRLIDIHKREDDLAYGDYCYTLVRRLTDKADEAPLVACISGGRRTMSAHVLTAMSICARPNDRVIHVLSDPEPERGETIYWPGHRGRRLNLVHVDMPFPRIRPVLQEEFLERLNGQYDLRTLTRVLCDYNIEAVPESVRIVLPTDLGHRTTVGLLDADQDTLAETTFTGRILATFLLLADRLEGARRQTGANIGAIKVDPEGSTEASASLIGRDAAECRRAVFSWCRDPAERAAVVPWTKEDAIKAVSRLNTKSGIKRKGVPHLFRKYLHFRSSPGHVLKKAGVEGITDENVRYRHWSSLHHLNVDIICPDGGPRDASRRQWPFQYIPCPRRP